MKLVRENIIFESFEEESDSIEDLQIGLPLRLMQKIKKLQEDPIVEEVILKDNTLFHSNYSIEVCFKSLYVPQILRTFYKYVDKKYIKDNYYDITPIVGFIIKKEYEDAFVKAFELMNK